MAPPDGTAKVPLTMISGFLGCGKTTLLRYLLENKADMKFGVIVNDVATINVDAKLIRNDRNRGRDQQLNTTADLTDTIELANGCACKPVYGFWCKRVMQFVCRPSLAATTRSA